MGTLERFTKRNRDTDEHGITMNPEYPEEFAPLVEKLLNDLNQGFVTHDYDNEDATSLLKHSKYEAILRRGRTYYLVRLLVTHRPEAERDNHLQVFELKSIHDNLLIFPRHRRYGALGEDGELWDYKDSKVPHGHFGRGMPEIQPHLYKLFLDASEAQLDLKSTKKQFERQLEIDRIVGGRVIRLLYSEQKV